MFVSGDLECGVLPCTCIYLESPGAKIGAECAAVWSEWCEGAAVVGSSDCSADEYSLAGTRQKYTTIAQAVVPFFP